MKTSLILSLLSISLITSLKNVTFTTLQNNIPSENTITGESINYYTVPISLDASGVPQDIQISSTLLSSNVSNNLVPIVVSSFKPLPNKDKNSQKLLGEVGTQALIDSTFLQKSINQKLYIAVFGQNCRYQITATYLNTKTVLLAQPLRSLAEEGLKEVTNTTEQERRDFIRADGISALVVAFILIFVSIIACVIMMKSYVHTTALVEKPLKLGRVEA